MSNDRGVGTPVGIALVLLFIILMFVALDVVTDYQSGASAGHLVVELSIMLASAAGIVLLWRAHQADRALVNVLKRDVAIVKAEADEWRANTQRLLGELAIAVNGQFDEWGLTEAERTVAFALLRGLSHKEIAHSRQTSERTVREQARSVYQKAGLDGRSTLSAFFLWGLLPPTLGISSRET